MNNGTLGFQVPLGHLDLQLKAEGVREAKAGDLITGDFTRAHGKLICWDEEIHEADTSNPV